MVYSLHAILIFVEKQYSHRGAVIMKRWYIFLPFLWSMYITGSEYLYPVGHIEQDGFKLLLLYQKSMHHVELWQWDPITQEARKALLSSYTPAGISLLPHGNGFSFIDNDTIRVSYIHKRSPMLIPLYEPLYDFTTIHWFDVQHCILSAKEKERYGIYIIDTEGQCTQILHDKESDYRYPYLIENNLFYIHVQDGHYAIMRGTIDLGVITASKKITAQDIFNDSCERFYYPVQDVQSLIDCKESHVAFLTMKDQDTGFYLEHPARIDRHDTTIAFMYHQIEKQGDRWQDKVLFTFSIPMAYLMSPQERLYESILPFLPKQFGDVVYYFDCQQSTMSTQLWSYDIQMRQTTQLTTIDQSVMGTYQYQNKMWYGGVLQDNALPNAWVNTQGLFCVCMPFCYTEAKKN